MTTALPDFIPGDALFVATIRYDSGGGYGPAIPLTPGTPVTNADDASIPAGIAIMDMGTCIIINPGDVQNPLEEVQGTHFIEISLGKNYATTRPRNFPLNDGTLTKDIPVHVEYTGAHAIMGVRQRYVVGPYDSLDPTRKALLDYYLSNGPSLEGLSSTYLRTITVNSSSPRRVYRREYELSRRNNFLLRVQRRWSPVHHVYSRPDGGRCRRRPTVYGRVRGRRGSNLCYKRLRDPRGCRVQAPDGLV